jgi:hypothetical protein
MIYSNPNLHQNLRIHLVLNGKLLIVKLQQKNLVQVEIIIPIMAVLLLIVVDIVHHQQKHQHLIVVQLIMVMHKNVFPMQKRYQVINFLTKIPIMMVIMSNHVFKVVQVSQVKNILVIQIKNLQIVQIIKVLI